MRSDICQPTIRREYKSMTELDYIKTVLEIESDAVTGILATNLLWFDVNKQTQCELGLEQKE
jgi:hypothetical protein